MKRLALILLICVIGQIPFALSVRQNIQEAKRASERAQATYKQGLIDGALSERGMMLREQAEQELLADARREKL